jgi:HlyD family secretion protein
VRRSCFVANFHILRALRDVRPERPSYSANTQAFSVDVELSLGTGLAGEIGDSNPIMTMQPERQREPAGNGGVLPVDGMPNGAGVIVANHGTGLPASLPSVKRKPYRGPRLRLWLAGAAVTALAGAALWVWLSPDAALVRYKTVPVDRGPIVASVTATGTVNPVVSVQVGSQVSGKIAKLFADFNSVVTEGQVIAMIDDKPFRARVKQATATLKSARGNLARAKTTLAQRALELNRASRLRIRGFVSQAELDLAKTNYRDAQAQVEVAQAQVDQAEAALSSAELDLGYTTIYSPVTGTVVSRNVDVGQTVAASFQTPTLFVIAQDLSLMQVNANVSESDIGGVTEGNAAEFRVDAYPNEVFKGTVTQVRNAPISIQNVVTYDVVIGVDNRDFKLKPGMTATVSIVAAHKEGVLRVPNTALRFRLPGAPADRKKSQVWVVDPEGRLHPVPVSTGLTDGTFTEIIEGELGEGDRVVIGLESVEERARQELPPGFGMGPRIR